MVDSMQQALALTGEQGFSVTRSPKLSQPKRAPPKLSQPADPLLKKVKAVLDNVRFLISEILYPLTNHPSQKAAPKLWSNEENQRLIAAVKQYGLTRTLVLYKGFLFSCDTFVFLIVGYDILALELHPRTAKEIERYIKFYARPDLLATK